MEITSEQWTIYLERYEKLIYTISRKISGDLVFANLEDNYADLVVAAINSINGFHKKTGKSVDEMFDDPLFDKYTKTCLWNHKNNKGNQQEKKRPFFSKCNSIDHEVVAQQVCYSVSDTSIYTREKLKQLPEREQQALDIILETPDLLQPSGKINIRG